MIKTTTVTYLVTVLMVIVCIGSILVWYVTLPRLPDQPILLTGEQGGQYYKLGSEVAGSMQRRLGRRSHLHVESTTGSKDNFDRLTDGSREETDLAIVQGGTVPLEQLATVAPLYPEYVHVIVRAESGINSIAELAGRRIAMGLEGSGERMTAQRLLDYYDIKTEQLADNKRYFKDMLQEDSPIEGAIVTTGIQHPDLIELLGTKQFRLLSIDIAPAIEMADPFLRHVEIPKGLYGQTPPIPQQRVTTLATTAYLVTSEDAPSQLVDAALGAIYEDNLRIQFPNLISRSDAPAWVSTRLHPVSRKYFHPADNLGLTATVLESLAAGKELLLALAAMVYLIWRRWRQAKRLEEQRQFARQKEHLDLLLQQTLVVESELAACTDLEQLNQFMQEVTRIKVNALREFTAEELRGDNTFSIFLQQCDGLIGAIGRKIMNIPRTAD